MSEQLSEVLGEIRKKLSEDEYNTVEGYIKGVRERNLAVLGKNEAFALRDSSGEIRAFEHTVHLSMADGTLVQIKGVKTVSAQGYERLSEGTGTIVMNAPHVLVDGSLQQNPYVIRDESNGRILAIYCRAIAFRYSSKGIPQVSDRTTIFDVPSYRLIDLLAKAKDFPQAFKLLPNGMDPNGEKGATWANYAFDENTNLWINTSHEEALQFYAQIINREKKALDFAQTFAQRNAVKHLLGIQKVPPRTDEKGKVIDANPSNWNVPVICWRPTSGNLIKWDATRYAIAQGKLEELAGGQSDVEETLRIEEAAIEISHGQDYVGEDDIQEATEPEDMVDETLKETPKPPKDEDEPGRWATRKLGEEPDPSPPPEKKATVEHKSTEDQTPKDSTIQARKTATLYQQLAATAEAVPEIYEEALRRLKMKSKENVKDYSVEEARSLLAKCNELSI